MTYIVDELPIAIDGDVTRQVYNPGIVPVKDTWLFDIFRIFLDRTAPTRRFLIRSYTWGTSLVAPRLFVSEDGISFRPVGESPYIDLGFGEDLDTRQVRMVAGFIEHGDEMWQYYVGHQTGHTLARGKRPRKKCAVMRAVQRRDGFAAMTAGAEGGEIVSFPVKCAGENLYVNYDAGAFGEVRVELLTPRGNLRLSLLIQRFWSATRCVREHRRIAVTCGLDGREVRFFRRNARLFSFIE